MHVEMFPETNCLHALILH